MSPQSLSLMLLLVLSLSLDVLAGLTDAAMNELVMHDTSLTAGE